MAKPIDRMDLLQLADDLTAFFALSKAFAIHRIETPEQGGRIIQIASLMTTTVREHNAPYAASKGGVGQLTKALAVDWARYGITVNAIGPGFTRTELTSALWQDPDFNQWIETRTPMARWAEPEDIAAAALFFASKEAAFITGQILYVDGGLLARF